MIPSQQITSYITLFCLLPTANFRYPNSLLAGTDFSLIQMSLLPDIRLPEIMRLGRIGVYDHREWKK